MSICTCTHSTYVLSYVHTFTVSHQKYKEEVRVAIKGKEK